MSIAGREGCLRGKHIRFISSASLHRLKIALGAHWRFYVDEGVELAIFMISACFFTVWLFDPGLPALHFLPSSALRRFFMGISMGGTAILIIRSPMGKRSGAHFNPAITLTYFRLGKIDKWDTSIYVVSQFIGGICGVGLSALCLRSSLALPTVDYVVTVPRWGGTADAFCAEYFMAALSSCWSSFGSRTGLRWLNTRAIWSGL